MKKKFFIFFSFLFLGIIFFLLWWHQATSPPNPSSKNTVNFTINKGEEIRSIATSLKRKGLIRSPLAFFLLVRFGKIAKNIQAGEFQLSPSLDLYTLTLALTSGREDVWVSLIEGWRKEEVAEKIFQTLGIPEKEFLQYAQEGFLFPDTYLLPKNSSAQMIVKILSENFQKKISPEILKKAEKKGLSLDEVIKIASLVEREAKFPQDRPLIASVILNRLKIGMKLDIDATVQYALGYQEKEKTWWKKNLDSQDLKIDSPYNTYKNPGLPPTPIANPGLEAILAVVNAPKTEYLYYLSDQEGHIHFAKDFKEHQRNIQKYLEK